MKTCSGCQVPKVLEDFALNRRKKDGRQSLCRVCQKPRQRAWYDKNKTTHKKRVRVRSLRMRTEVATKLLHYLLTHPCVDCGEADPIVLDFDHVRGKKRANVTILVAAGMAWSTIEAEVAKCDVRCANCHRRKTARERGTERHKLYQVLKEKRHETAQTRGEDSSSPLMPNG